jgi:hypothetical protein
MFPTKNLQQRKIWQEILKWNKTSYLWKKIIEEPERKTLFWLLEEMGRKKMACKKNGYCSKQIL